MHRIGPELGLQTHAVVFAVYGTVLATALRQEPGGVHLHSRQRGLCVHADAAFGAVQPCRMAAIQAEVVVVAAIFRQLRRTQPLTQCRTQPQIQRRAVHRPHLAGGDGALSAGRVAVGIDLQHMAAHRTARLPRQIEIGVVGEVAHRVPVGGGFVVDDQRTVTEGVGYADLQRSGVAVLSVRGNGPQRDGVLCRLLPIPHLLVQTVGAAVQLIVAFVGRQTVFHPVQHKLRPGDAVGAPAHHSTQIAIVFFVFLQSFIAQHNITATTVPDRYPQPLQRGAVRQDVGFICPLSDDDFLHSCLPNMIFSHSITILPR